MEQALTIRDWYEEHEDQHAGQPCAGKPFMAFLANWVTGTAYIDDHFLFEEVSEGTLVMVHHTREEWIRMATVMRLTEAGFTVVDIELVSVDDAEDETDERESFADSVRETIDRLGRDG